MRLLDGVWIGKNLDAWTRTPVTAPVYRLRLPLAAQSCILLVDLSAELVRPAHGHRACARPSHPRCASAGLTARLCRRVVWLSCAVGSSLSRRDRWPPRGRRSRRRPTTTAAGATGRHPPSKSAPVAPPGTGPAAQRSTAGPATRLMCCRVFRSVYGPV